MSTRVVTNAPMLTGIALVLSGCAGAAAYTGSIEGQVSGCSYLI